MLPLHGRKRRDRREYAAVVTAKPNLARGIVGYRVVYDGGLRPEGRVHENDVRDIPHDLVGCAVTSPLPAGAPRLDDDAESGSENDMTSSSSSSRLSSLSSAGRRQHRSSIDQILRF